MDFFGSYGFMLILVLISICASVSGLFLVRRRFGHFLLESHHSVAGPFLSIVATLYAVVLGFIVVDALNTFQKARYIVEQEANAFHDIFHLAQGLSEPTRSDLRRLCADYTGAMIVYEWPAMEHGQQSADGHKIFTRLWHDVSTFHPISDAENTFLQAILDELKTAGDARHSRALAAQPIYDPALWALLLIGAIVVISFTYLFIAEKLVIQAIMTALVTIVVALNLVVVALFDSPFSGDVKVSPQAFAVTHNSLKAEVDGQ